MLVKLKKNAHKGRWEDVNLGDAFYLMQKEVEELSKAMEGGNTIEIILEAADIANFAMILSSIKVERG